MTDHFVFDDFARKHLNEWFAAGLAPGNWTLNTLLDFHDYVEEYADTYPYDVSWSTISKHYEAR